MLRYKISNAPSAGVFFVSQDADLHDGQENEAYFKLQDAGRRAQGIPRVDTHVYARENGWMIAALCDYYAASGDGSALTQAQRAAAWITVHRSLPGGGFRHDDVDTAGPYLGDTLAMGQAFLALYNVTGIAGFEDCGCGGAVCCCTLCASCGGWGICNGAEADQCCVSTAS